MTMATQHHLSETVSLDDVLTSSEQALIAEALARLKERKQAAFQHSHETAGITGRVFDEHDFGIPQIDKLLKRF